MTTAIRLLMVEDDQIDQRAFVRMVQRDSLPYDCVLASSLREARQQLSAQPFDLVICDYLLGDGTAIDLLHTHPDCPMIVITGAGDETIAVTAMKAGAKDYLVKDVQGDYLGMLPRMVETTLRLLALEAAEREQRTFAALLHDTARILNSTLDTDEILRLILDNIRSIIPHDAANIMLIEDGVARVVQYSGWPPDKAARIQALRFPVQQISHLHLMAQTRHLYIIGDITTLASWQPLMPDDEPVAYLAAPICVEDQVIGFLNLDSMTRDHFTPAHAQRLQAFVDQVAVALKNAHLYRHAQELAALQERQRLARDLHDSVTQTLFAASVVATAIIKQWQRQPDSIGDDLDDLRELTIGALAEMRTLLFELRPNTLLEADLSALLRQLAESVRGRARLKVRFETTGTCPLPAPMQVAFFRIAQEALNNVVKHARARHLDLLLHREHGLIRLIVRDDGRGFDPAHRPANHFGIPIMHERAAEAGITLTIASAPGQGTQVTAVWTYTETED